ncbi:MAG: ribokinase, partial [Ferruginibacter sp.]
MKLQSKKILIIGSSNTDMVIRTHEFPIPGQTILGGEFIMNAGGKGANQAVAAARLGAKISFVTKIGKDVFGSYTLSSLRYEGIDTATIIKTAKHPSGVALITVNNAGENTIVVAPGANMQLTAGEIKEDLFESAGMILIQLEIPLSTIGHIIQTANKHKVNVVLNPAPAATLTDSMLHGLYLVTPNEIETEMLTGIYPDTLPAMRKAGKFFMDKGVQNVVITLGAKGVFLMTAS